MKTITTFFIMALAFFGNASTAFGQNPGRVVINEYMPWTSNGCGATAEFVELLNFGPGPINIGCYILTDGDFAVTIPPNTILKPGEFYLIAGQNFIPAPCANIDSGVTADLNWNTCGCTSAPIPTTGDGFFTDGGFAAEQIVLMDPNKKVVDAVIRELPGELSSLITTNSVGGCAPVRFNLDTMKVVYEVLGMSAGRGNSFARKLDGDCGWVKDPQQSGNATNNTPGESSTVSYNFSIVQAMDCNSTGGAIDVYVNVGSNTDVFPMEYTIAFDADKNGIFDFSDKYTYGTDSTPPSIVIQGLPLGHYRVTVGSSKGCFLKTFEFRILECTGVLPVGLHQFSLQSTKDNVHTFEWLVSGLEGSKEVALEKSIDGINFYAAATIPTTGYSGTKHFTQIVPAEDGKYRVRLTRQNGQVTYSNQITVSALAYSAPSVSPNPARDKVTVSFNATKNGLAYYKLYALSGAVVAQGKQQATYGINALPVSLSHLPPGVYHLALMADDGAEPITFRIVKQ